MTPMDPSTDDHADLEARLRNELTRYAAPIEPSPELRETVNRLTDRHPTAWSRWRGPLIAAAAVAAIATLTSVVLLTRGPNAMPSNGQSTGTAQPFAPEPPPSPELELDPPTAVTYSEGEHGTPSDEFRTLGQDAANALQNNDVKALSALQDPSSQQPNLMAGLIEIYGGKPVKVVEYMESSIREFPYAAVDYSVDCSSGKDVRFSLTFNYINGRWALLPLQQGLWDPEPTVRDNPSMALPGLDPSQMSGPSSAGISPGPARDAKVYPTCPN